MSQMTQMDERQDPQTFAIIGAAMEVHSVLGPGFLEPVYQESLAMEFHQRAIPFERELRMTIRYKGQELPCGYRADFVCYSAVIVELKAINHLGGAERSQTINYLKATGFQRALLLNFGSGRLEYERFLLTPPSTSSAPSATSVDRSALAIRLTSP